jgi:hypothetical protein
MRQREECLKTTQGEKAMNELHKLINQLIALNHKNRESISEDTIKALPVDSFCREYCTVKIDIGRQTGKSKYIHANSDKKTLIVVRKHDHRREYLESQALVLTVNEIISGRHLAKPPFETIYFDEPAFLFRGQYEIDQIYHLLSRPLIRQTFIHLGC